MKQLKWALDLLKRNPRSFVEGLLILSLVSMYNEKNKWEKESIVCQEEQSKKDSTINAFLIKLINDKK